MVTDFVDLHTVGYHWPTFNVADIAISAGTGILILSSLSSRSHCGREAL
jgi:signal peptidase II